MATGNLFLGTANRSVGDVTLYRSRGQQRARVRVRNVANPRSYLQLLTRSILANVSRLYSLGYSVFSNSFQHYPAAVDAQSYFLKVNTALLRSLFVADFNNASQPSESSARIGARGVRSAAPFLGMVLSEGTLQQNVFSWDGETYSFSLPSIASGSSMQAKDYAAEANLVPGDIFTFLVFSVNTDEPVGTFAPDGVEPDEYSTLFDCGFGWVQLKVKDTIFTDTNTVDNTSKLDILFDLASSGEIGAMRNFANVNLGNPVINATTMDSSGVGGWACIRSRYDSPLRSDAVLLALGADSSEYGLTYHFLANAWGDGSAIAVPTKLLSGVNFT